MANEFIIKNGFRSRGNSQITGSLTATSFAGDGTSLTGNPVFNTAQASQLIATSRVNTDAFRVVTDNEFTFIGGGINVGGDVTSSAGILATGTVLGSNLSGTNTGDQDLSPYALIAAISGSFTTPSASFSSRTTTLENKTIYSGSFSGSFQGDGSALTGVSVFPFTGDAQITGSLKVSGSIDYEIPDSQFKSYKVPGYYRKAFANNTGDAVQYVDDYIEIHFNDAGTDDIEMTIMKDPSAGEVHITINNEGTYTYLDRKIADSRFDLNASFGNDEFNQVDVRAPSDITWPWYRITFINANSTSGNFVTMLIEKFI